MLRWLAACGVLWCCACEYDPSCKVVLKYASTLSSRLTLPEETERANGEIDLARMLTPELAELLLAEADAIEEQLPASARAEDLNMVLTKLAARRSAFEQALRDFLAIDARQLDKGLESGATMPLRRGVKMSRDAMLPLADMAVGLCRMHE